MRERASSWQQISNTLGNFDEMVGSTNFPVQPSGTCAQTDGLSLLQKIRNGCAKSVILSPQDRRSVESNSKFLSFVGLCLCDFGIVVWGSEGGRGF
jgi:hypothetical protein